MTDDIPAAVKSDALQALAWFAKNATHHEDHVTVTHDGDTYRIDITVTKGETP